MNNKKEQKVVERSNMQGEKYSLIKGEFSADEAAEVIYELFNKKINFNETKSLSQFLRKGEKDPKTLQRIKELKSDLEKTKELIAHAKESGKKLRVDSNISIDLI